MINKLIGLPELASEHGLLIDNMLELLHWFIAILLVGWSAFYIYCLIRFRKYFGCPSPWTWRAMCSQRHEGHCGTPMSANRLTEGDQRPRPNGSNGLYTL